MKRAKRQTFLAIGMIVFLVISTSCSQLPTVPAISPTDLAATIEAAVEVAVAATVAAISAEAQDAPTPAAVIASPIVQATSKSTEQPSSEPTEVGIGPIITDTALVVTPITNTDTLTATVVPTTTVIPTATIIPTTTAITTATVEPTVTTIPTGTIEPTPSPIPTTTPPPPTPPTATPTAGPSPTPTPMPATVFLGSHHSYRAGSAFIVVGEAINGGSSPVFGVTIIATFHDAGGNLVGASESAALLPQTLPTQANPFKLQLLNAPANIDRYEVTLRWDEITINSFDRATIVREEISTNNGIEITGEIRNDHRSDLRNLVVVATFYDESGNVVDVVPGQTSVASLSPGDTATFSVQAQSIAYATYLVQIEGMLWR